MHTRIIALRPEPGLSSTLAAGQAAGLEITGHALSEIRPLSWDCPDPDSFDALLIGSANAIRHGGAALAQLIDKPVYAVGRATAQVARDAGFTVVMRGEGGLQKVLDAAPRPIHFLRLAGFDRVELMPPPGVSFGEVVAYESVALPLDPALFEGGDGSFIALLHSATQAVHFANECDRLEIDKSEISLAALGARISHAAGSGWRSIHTPEHPNDEALLAMVAKLCL
ncbi:MAG: uroporphyrinogen-III synthase [Pseudomonadota bacterium]|nr:uroporphyrinogen-III synthase [Pseudomonadota bacterium]